MSGRLRRAASRAVRGVLGASGVARLAAARGFRGLAITYHTIDAATLSDQLDCLQRGFELVGPDELLARVQHPPVRKARLPATLTFDDGKRSNLTEAAATLEEKSVPAVFFVTTDPARDGTLHWFDLAARARGALARQPDAAKNVLDDVQALARRTGAPTREVASLRVLKRTHAEERDSLLSRLADSLGLDRSPADDDERSLDPDEVRQLDRRGFVIGSHTCTHPILTREEGERAWQEISRSRALLEEWLEKPVVHFAYPNGNSSDETEALTRRAGYATAWTTRPMFLADRENAHRLPRIELVPEYDDADIVFKLAVGACVGLPNPDGTGREYRRNVRAHSPPGRMPPNSRPNS